LQEENASPATDADENQVEETEIEETEAGETVSAEDSADSTSEGAEPEKPAKAETPAQAAKRKWKINGQELDLSDEEIQELANRGHYFDRSRKEVDAARFTMAEFRKNPIEAAIQLFHNELGSREKAIEEVRKIMDGWYSEDLQFTHASEEEKQRILLERENQKFREEQAQRAARIQKARDEAEWMSFTDLAEKALKDAGAEFDDEAIDDLISVWNRAVDLEEEIDVSEVARRTLALGQKRSERNLQKLLKDPTKLAERAPELKEHVRKEDIDQLKAARSKRQPGPSAQRAPRETPKHPRKAMSMAQMDQELSRY